MQETVAQAVAVIFTFEGELNSIMGGSVRSEKMWMGGNGDICVRGWVQLRIMGANQ